MAKREKRDKGRELRSPSGASGPTLAQRHEFSAGLLGHDFTASQWLVNVSEKTALGLDVVQQCVQIIGDGVAGADIGQWNGNDRREQPSGFLLAPDPEMPLYDFLWMFAANLALYRAVWLEEVRLGGEFLGVRQHCIANVNRVAGKVYDGTTEIRNPLKLVRSSIWPTLDLDSGATIALAREIFAGQMAAVAYQSDFWQQGGAPVIILTTDQDLTTDQADGIRDRWVERRTTSPGMPAVLGKGAHANSFGADLGTEGAHVSADKMRASAARYFNMPPGFVNVLSESGPLTYTTTEAEFTRLVRITIQPYCNVIERALSSYLPGGPLLGEVVRLDPSRMTRADQLSRFTAWDIATGRKPWLLPSEVRTQEGYGPAPELDAVSTPEVVDVGA